MLNKTILICIGIRRGLFRNYKQCFVNNSEINNMRRGGVNKSISYCNAFN